ncbi:MAG: tetratricopeptide repeat protein [Prosthecobacter sp.]|uniref:tetratricopeptide repeat protein n=1 Tax=Prosthecobacter sp. TaxID=1965333 RepID=UPI00390035D6
MHLSSLLHAISMATALLLTSATVRAQSASDLMGSGDVFDRKFQAGKALEYYLPAEKLEPQNVPLLVRIARQYRHLMTDATTSAEKLRLGGSALSYGRRAAALAPNDSEAQLSPAITYGKMLPFQGTREQVDASPRIKAAADKALKLDQRNDVAWHVLGRWHQALANIGVLKRTLGGLIYGKLPTSTNEAAVACFDQAIAINPNRLRHYIELGRTYAQMGRTDEARKFITQGMAMPNKEHDDPELKERGRLALAKLP